MLDRLIDLIVGLLESARPWVVIRDYQEGVQMRLGRWKRNLLPGFHWLIPFADHVDVVVTVWTTITLPGQTVATKDGKVIAVKGMVKYRVSDAKAFTMDCYDAKDALSDIACGLIFHVVHTKTYEECLADDLVMEVSLPLKKASKKWGITVGEFTLTDFAEAMNVRLFNEGQNIG